MAFAVWVGYITPVITEIQLPLKKSEAIGRAKKGD
jgi:hypothetical protein